MSTLPPTRGDVACRCLHCRQRLLALRPQKGLDDLLRVRGAHALARDLVMVVVWSRWCEQTRA